MHSFHFTSHSLKDNIMTTDKVAALANAFAAKQNKNFGGKYGSGGKSSAPNKELSELKATVAKLTEKVEFLENALFSLIEVLEQTE